MSSSEICASAWALFAFFALCPPAPVAAVGGAEGRGQENKPSKPMRTKRRSRCHPASGQVSRMTAFTWDREGRQQRRHSCPLVPSRGPPMSTPGCRCLRLVGQLIRDTAFPRAARYLEPSPAANGTRWRPGWRPDSAGLPIPFSQSLIPAPPFRHALAG